MHASRRKRRRRRGLRPVVRGLHTDNSGNRHARGRRGDRSAAPDWLTNSMVVPCSGRQPPALDISRHFSRRGPAGRRVPAGHGCVTASRVMLIWPVSAGPPTGMTVMEDGYGLAAPCPPSSGTAMGVRFTSAALVRRRPGTPWPPRRPSGYRVRPGAAWFESHVASCVVSCRQGPCSMLRKRATPGMLRRSSRDVGGDSGQNRGIFRGPGAVSGAARCRTQRGSAPVI